MVIFIQFLDPIVKISSFKGSFFNGVPFVSVSYDGFVWIFDGYIVVLWETSFIVKNTTCEIKMLLCGNRTCGVASKSHINDFKLSVEACLPTIDEILVKVKNQAYPHRCFLNTDLPINVSNHKVTNSWFCNY